MSSHVVLLYSKHFTEPVLLLLPGHPIAAIVPSPEILTEYPDSLLLPLIVFPIWLTFKSVGILLFPLGIFMATSVTG